MTTLTDRLFPRRDRPGYLKEGRVQLSDRDAARVRCRGDVRAAFRRTHGETGVRSQGSRWRRANEVSLPFRVKIIARLLAKGQVKA